MPTESLPVILSEEDYAHASITFPSLQVEPPRLVTSAQNTTLKIFNSKTRGVAYRKIINNGATVAKISIGADPGATTVATTPYHFILKACSGAADGSGGEVDLSKFTGNIYAWSSDAAGLSILVVHGLTSEAMLPGTGSSSV